MSLTFLAQAQTGAPASPGGGIGFFVPMILIFVMMYFVMIRPQKRRQMEQQRLVNALKTGDKVITNGGLRGTIISIKDDAVQLRVPPNNLRLEVARSSIASVAKQEEAA